MTGTGRMNRGLAHVTLLNAPFLACRASLIGDSSSVTTKTILSGSCLHILGERFGEHYVAIGTMIASMMASSYATYIGGNMLIFVIHLSVIIMALLFSVQPALRCAFLGRHNASGNRVIAVTTLILRQLLDGCPDPTCSKADPNTLYHLHAALFSASFVLSIMALYLQVIGVYGLDPGHKSFGHARNNLPRFAASALYWSGAMLLVAYIIVSIIISSSGAPLIFKIFCAALSMCIVPEFLKKDCVGEVRRTSEINDSNTLGA